MHAFFIVAHNTQGDIVNININNIVSFNALATPTRAGGQTFIYCTGETIVVTESAETIRKYIDYAIKCYVNNWLCNEEVPEYPREF